MRYLIVVTFVLLALAAGVVWAFRTGAVAESARVRVVEEVTRSLGREVHIDALSGDPWRGIILHGVRVAGPPGSARAFLSVPRMVLGFEPGRLLSALLQGQGVLTSLTRIELERPSLELARNRVGRWNYPDLLAATRGTKAAPPSFLAVVEVREGRLAFTDALRLPQHRGPRPPEPFTVRFERVTGTLDFRPAPRTKIALDAVTTEGRTPALVRVAGQASLGEGTFDLDLRAQGGAVAVWGPYLVRLPGLVWGGGTFDSTMHLLASRWGGRVVLDYRGKVQLRDGRALFLPRRTLLSDIDGTLTVDNLGVSTAGVTMAVGASPVSARGRITFPGGGAMDLVLRSRTLDLRTLQATLFPRARVSLTGSARGEVRVTGSIGSPRVEGRIVRASGAIDRQGFADLSGHFSYYAGLLMVDELAASAGGGQVRGQLRLNTGTGAFFMLADARGIDTRVLDGLGLARAPSFSGTATGVIAATRTQDGLLAQGRLALGQGSAFGIGFDGAEAIFGYDRGRFEVDHLVARSGATSLHASGEISRAGALDVAVAGTAVDLHTVGERFGLQRWIAGTTDVDGRLVGTLRQPAFDGTLRARDGHLGPLPFDLVRGRLHLTSTGLRTPGLLLDDAGSRYFAAGLIRWGEPARVDLTARAAEMTAQRLLDLAGVPLAAGGTIETTVHLTGPLTRPTARGVVDLRGGHVEGQRLDRARAAFMWTETGLLIEEMEAGVNGSTLLASGTVSRRGALGISFSAQGLDLGDVSALKREALQVSGDVDLTGTIRGTLRAPVLSATATSTSLAVNGQAFDQARGQVSYRDGRLALTPLLLQQGAGTFELRGTILPRDDPVLDLRIGATQGSLATLLGLARVRPPLTLGGTLDGEVTVTGSLRDPRAALSLHLTDGRMGVEPIREAFVRADLANRAVTLETLRIAPARGELVGAGRIHLEGRSEVEFGGTDLDVDLFGRLLGLRWPLDGSLDFTLQLTGELNDPQIGLSASVVDGGIGAIPFDRLTLQAYYRAGQFNIEQGVIQEDRHRVQLAGSLPFNPGRMRLDESQPVNLQLELVDSDLSLLGLLTDRVERAEGRLAGTVSVAGTAAQPQFEGRVTAAEGTLKLSGLDPPLTGLQAEITFTADTVRVDSLRAQAGEGTLTLTGSVGLRRFRPSAVDLALSADGARIELPGFFAGRIDGTIRAAGALPSPQITGTAALSHGDLFVSAAQGLVARPADGTTGPRLNVDVQAGDALWVNVGGLRFEIGGALRALGTPAAPRLSGEIVAERGTFVAFNTTFRLVEGRATFSDLRGVTPLIDAVAETRLSIPRAAGPPPSDFVRATVRLHVTGTPGALDFELTSDPPFPRNAIIAALGRQSGFAALLGGGAELEAALLNELSNALFGQVGRAVAGALGLEEFTLQYDAEHQLSLRIGTLLIKNLYLTWTTYLTRTSSSTTTVPPAQRTEWALEYRISPTARVSFAVDNLARWNVLYRVTYLY